MGNAAHILNVKIQFEKFSPTETKPFTKGIDKAVREGFERGAKAGGNAMINQIDSVQKAWEEFDWGHPIQSVSRMWDVAAKRMKEAFGPFAIPIVMGIAAITDNLLNMIHVQGDLVKMFSMLRTDLSDAGIVGQDMGTRVAKALSDINEVAFETTGGIKEIADRYINLAQQRVPVKDLKDLSKLSFLASKALGADNEAMDRFIGKLKVMGGLSNIQIRGVVEQFGRIQSAVGLTNNEVSELIGTTTKLTQLISGMTTNNTAAIENMAGATAQLTGIFGELGLDAGKAGEMMERFFDPTKTADNAFLISRMGMSMSEYFDILNGGAMDQDKFVNGVLEAAKSLNTMGKSTAMAQHTMQALSDVTGLTRAEIMTLADRGEAALDIISKMKDSGPSLEEQAAQGMSDLSGALTKLGNVFGAFFGKRLAGFIGVLTNALEALNEWWLKNSDAIDKFFDDMLGGITNFLKNLKPEDIISFFKGILEGVKNIIGFIGELAKSLWLIPVILIAWKVGLPIITSLAGGIANLVGKMAGLGSAAGGAATSMSSFSQAAGAGIQSFLQMAGMAVVLLSVGAAIWLMSDALEKLTKVIGDPNFPIAIAVLAGMLIVLAGAVLAASMIFVNPVVAAGAAIFAGVLIAIASAVMIFAIAASTMANAMKTISEAFTNFDKLSDDINKDMTNVGKGMDIFTNSAKNMINNMDILKFVLIADNLKELGVGFWVLSKAILELNKVQDANKIDAGFNGLKKAISALTVGPFVGDMKNAAEGFKSLAEGIKTLSDPSLKFDNVGMGLNQFTTAVEDWLSSLKKNTGWFENIKNTGEGFKELSVGIWVLSKTRGVLTQIGKEMEQASQGIGMFMQALMISNSYGGSKDQLVGLGEGMKQLAVGLYVLGKTDVEKASTALVKMRQPLIDVMNAMQRGDDVKKAGEGFSSLFSSIGGLPTEIPRLSQLAFDIASIGAVLVTFQDKAANASREFANFMKAMENSKPIRLISDESETKFGGETKEEVSVLRTLDIKLHTAFKTEIDRLIDVIKPIIDNTNLIATKASETSDKIKKIYNMANSQGLRVKSL